jgi:hypothetical protein
MRNDIRHDFGKDVQEEDLGRIAGMVATIADREPPGEIIDSVMARIKPKKLSRLRILWRRIQFPVSFAPVRVASLATMAGLALFAVVFFVDRTPVRTPATALRRVASDSERTVVFSLNMPGASRVELIGSFNEWRPGDFVMKWDESRKVWITSVSLRKGRYEYAFLVDGEKVVSDPNALVYLDDGFGNKNSVLIVDRNNGHEVGI